MARQGILFSGMNCARSDHERVREIGGRNRATFPASQSDNSQGNRCHESVNLPTSFCPTTTVMNESYNGGSGEHVT